MTGYNSEDKKAVAILKKAGTWLVVILAFVAARAVVGAVRESIAERDQTPLQREIIAAIRDEDAYDLFRRKLLEWPKGAERDSGMALSTRGIKRLPDDALETRARILGLVFDRIDADACGQLVAGHPSVRALDGMMTAINALPEVERREWAHLSALSMRAELLQLPKPASDSTAFLAALMKVVQNVPKPDSARFLEALAVSESASNADQCFMGKTLYAQGLALSDRDRRALLRGLTE